VPSLQDAVITGVIQGLLEWVPISSRGNIILLMMALFGQDASQALSYSVYLHMGTGLAALVYLRKDVVSILLRRDEQSRRLFNFLLIATLFTGLVGLPIFLFLEASFGYGEAILGLMGLALIATGLIQRASPRKEDKGIDLGLRDGIVFGSIQGLSVIPGLSRSGLTTSAFLFKRFGGEDAFKLSFLMSIPASFAASIGLLLLNGPSGFDTSTLVGILAAFVSGMMSMSLMLMVAKRTSLWKLCVGLGSLVVVVYLVGVLSSFL
jgi:undecaprenyl-diphosphatase